MKRLFVILVVATLLVAGVSLFGTQKASQEPTYVTQNVGRGDIRKIIRASGTVSAVITVAVSSQVSGQIADVLSDFNDEVQEGQVLARLDQKAFRATVQKNLAALQVTRSALATKRAELQQAEADRDNAVASLAVAEAEYESAQVAVAEAEAALRRKQALSTRGVASVSALDDAQFTRNAALSKLRAAEAQVKVQQSSLARSDHGLTIAKSEVARAEAEVAQQQAELRLAEVELERTEIKAPINGVVISRDINKGQTVAASFEAPTLFTLAQDLRDIKVEASVDEADIGSIRQGQEATFTVDAFPSDAFSGRVQQIRKSSYLYENVVTYSVIILAANPELKLLPGMTANAEIVTDAADDVVIVPNAALRFTPPGYEVRPDDMQWDAISNDTRSGRLQVASKAGVPASLAKTLSEPPGEPPTHFVWGLDEMGKPKPIPIVAGLTDGISTAVVAGSIVEGDVVITRATPPASENMRWLWPW